MLPVVQAYSSMSVTAGWSVASDPLYASSLVTLPYGHLLAVHPQSPPTAVFQSRTR